MNPSTEIDLSSHGIVALIRNTHGEYLLLEEAREQLHGHWAPPHGRLEVTDSSEEAGVEREVLEETGLAVHAIKKILTQPADTKVKTVSFWVVELDAENQNTPQTNEESSSYGWFTVENALRQLQLYPGTLSFFERVITGEIQL